MIRLLTTLFSYCWAFTAHAFTLSLSSDDFQLSPVFSDVGFFTISVDINAQLAAGAFVNPDITNVTIFRVKPRQLGEDTSDQPGEG